MSSKYIPNKNKVQHPQKWEWSSDKVDFSKIVEDYEETTTYSEVKEKIQSKPLEEVSFKDIYKLPFHRAKYGNWVYDANSNFVFQFEFKGDETKDKILEILNGELEPIKGNIVKHRQGTIFVEKDGEDKALILIRGWGNLTGTGAYNLDGEYAGKIQDTLAEYIVERLTKN